MIAKLNAAQGTAGYDIVVPTGVYIPQMVQLGLLAELDLANIPNFKNIETQYTNQPWDPDNLHSVCKDWGSTGWIYDTEAIDGDDHHVERLHRGRARSREREDSVLDAPGDLCGIYFWANGIDWTTEDQADLDACQEFIVNELAPHIKAFDSYPGIALTQGNYVLSQVVERRRPPGSHRRPRTRTPERYKWGLGAPKTELWMDNWCILAEAENVNAAYAWINFILQPDDLA